MNKKYLKYGLAAAAGFAVWYVFFKKNNAAAPVNNSGTDWTQLDTTLQSTIDNGAAPSYLSGQSI